jgi:hypothetical protein
MHEDKARLMMLSRFDKDISTCNPSSLTLHKPAGQ